MKIRLLFTAVLILLLQSVTYSQKALSRPSEFSLLVSTPVMKFDAPDREVLREEDKLRDEQGMIYRIGVAAYTNITTQNSGAWSTGPNGERIWQLGILFQDAEALSFLFDQFVIDEGTVVNVFDNKGKKLHPTVTASDMNERQLQHIPLCAGDEMVLEIKEPAGAQPSQIQLGRIMYNYRSTGKRSAEKDFNDSGSCEINVNCSPVGDSWQDEKRGIARIYIVDGSLAGWCSGSLVNNLAQDCKPYFLTAQHCGVDVSASDLAQWVFNFAYEAPGCTDPATESGLDVSAKRITGCFVIANSAGVTTQSISSSDFLLLQLGTVSNEQSVITKLKTPAINAYWNGWDANNTATTGGAGIHHPAGDIKKISTFTGTLVSTTSGSSTVQNTHWRVTWTSNSNGFGVTEGGSSGSPIFNNNDGNSRIIGTLTGGGSSCSAQTSPDRYGKMSYHWTSNGSAENRRLQPWLDPNGTGLLVCNGSSNPCAVTGTAPVAQFIGTPVTVNVGGTVLFTDQSSNAPTSWSWSISPVTGWSYVNGTSAASQNPEVTFTVQGTYSVTLTASNNYGSDSEIKDNYITVTIVSAPCTATSQNCAEYISNVQLETLENPSLCTYYQSYVVPTTSLQQGAQYTLTVTPTANGEEGSAYTGDEIAAWIDWNHDFDFTDEGERIAYVIVATGWNNQFTFTVPMSASTGALPMRVRMSYQPEDGDIQPCGISGYGEVEDYLVTVNSVIAGTEEYDLLQSVAIFPNPASSNVSVDLRNVKSAATINLTDLTGKILKTVSAEGGSIKEIELDGIAQGSYLITITSGSARITKSIVKN